jgi:hypothetical protein
MARQESLPTSGNVAPIFPKIIRKILIPVVSLSNQWKMSGPAHSLPFPPLLGTFLPLKRTHWFKNGSMALTIAIIALSFAEIAQAQDLSRLIGRWNLTVQGSEGAHPSWLEVRKSGNKSLVGSFVGQFGSARPVGKIEFDGNLFRFSVPPQWEKRNDDLVFFGTFKGKRIQGPSTDLEGNPIHWTGQKSPKLKRRTAPSWGDPRMLFDGQTLNGWKPRSSAIPNGWEVTNGLLSNANPGNDLITKEKFDDFKLQAEFRYPKGSNSGIYLRGRYEMQIEDNYGDEPESHKVGGIYGFPTPSTNASKPAGEWQSAEVTLVGRVVTVILNGERVIDRQTIPGATGGAFDNDEASPGPLMIQGDHGQVEFRKLSISLPPVIAPIAVNGKNR